MVRSIIFVLATVLFALSNSCKPSFNTDNCVFEPAVYGGTDVEGNQIVQTDAKCYCVNALEKYKRDDPSLLSEKCYDHVKEDAHGNEVDSRVDDENKYGCQTPNECKKIAIEESAVYYGLELPQGCDAGKAQCRLFSAEQIKKLGPQRPPAECIYDKTTGKKGHSYKVYVKRTANNEHMFPPPKEPEYETEFKSNNKEKVLKFNSNNKLLLKAKEKVLKPLKQIDCCSMGGGTMCGCPCSEESPCPTGVTAEYPFGQHATGPPVSASSPYLQQCC